MGPMQTESLEGKKYVFVVVDDFSRFTWVRFLKGKSDTAKVCINLCLSLQHEQGKSIIRIRNDHGKEFENEELDNFCEVEGIHHEYSAPLNTTKWSSREKEQNFTRDGSSHASCQISATTVLG
ncbi:F5J5.1 [Cucumis melo var. makuwa]|uniref:F5J5.1 n=1 Tax=Cucumis melo var. makuwa TaxID=1194695 RepID=A0A5D3C5M0_CUCMM|nr:F5J5.1 [Cucumis melo var. makuwa]